jgi:hypothetical protein
MVDPLPIARRLWQRTRLYAMPAAVDGDAEPISATAPNLSEPQSVETIPDRDGDLVNVAFIVADRSTNP